MNTLIIHNSYQHRGGEDAVVDTEIQLLRTHGHKVVEYRRSNDELTDLSSAQAAMQTFWSRRSVSGVAKLVAAEDIEVVHCHNTFPLISPAVYWAATRARVPVVQTLHNFRLICPQALMLRNEAPCEDCVGHVPWRGVMHGCYRGSRLQTGVLAGMITAHRVLGTWGGKVARYIALNEFCRQKFIQGGLPADRIVVKPNFVDAGPAPVSSNREGALYVGRLSQEKGISVLADAMRRLQGRVGLTVVGTGPRADLLTGLPGVTLLGALPGDQVLSLMRQAQMLVLPSICYENFPRTLAEAFGCGLPVVASRLGAMAHLIDHDRNGFLFDAGNANALATAMDSLASDPQRCSEMGLTARQTYEESLTPEINYKMLMQIYEDALCVARGP
jgi:glycosyltransferase involved in cell wall biosynthesis